MCWRRRKSQWINFCLSLPTILMMLSYVTLLPLCPKVIKFQRMQRSTKKQQCKSEVFSAKIYSAGRHSYWAPSKLLYAPNLCLLPLRNHFWDPQCYWFMTALLWMCVFSNQHTDSFVQFLPSLDLFLILFGICKPLGCKLSILLTVNPVGGLCALTFDTNKLWQGSEWLTDCHQEFKIMT